MSTFGNINIWDWWWWWHYIWWIWQTD